MKLNFTLTLCHPYYISNILHPFELRINMAHILIAEDTEAYQEAYMEEFIKGFEILKLRIGKLKSYSTELDQMVSASAYA